MKIIIIYTGLKVALQYIHCSDELFLKLWFFICEGYSSFDDTIICVSQTIHSYNIAYGSLHLWGIAHWTRYMQALLHTIRRHPVGKEVAFFFFVNEVLPQLVGIHWCFFSCIHAVTGIWEEWLAIPFACRLSWLLKRGNGTQCIEAQCSVKVLYFCVTFCSNMFRLT